MKLQWTVLHEFLLDAFRKEFYTISLYRPSATNIYEKNYTHTPGKILCMRELLHKRRNDSCVNSERNCIWTTTVSKWNLKTRAWVAFYKRKEKHSIRISLQFLRGTIHEFREKFNTNSEKTSTCTWKYTTYELRGILQEFFIKSKNYIGF